MKSLFIILSIILVLISRVAVKPVMANSSYVDTVSCLAPTGTIKANYESGKHGIVGDNGIYTGSDKVYLVNDYQLMQCFCADDGSGIQTDWKKVSLLTSDEAKILKNQGWIEVPSGLPWGLEDLPYMARNANYTCKSNSGGPGDGKSDGRSDGRSDGKSSYVQSESSNAPSLASTGNISLLFALLGLGILSTTAGLVLRRKGN